MREYLENEKAKIDSHIDEITLLKKELFDKETIIAKNDKEILLE